MTNAIVGLKDVLNTTIATTEQINLYLNILESGASANGAELCSPPLDNLATASIVSDIICVAKWQGVVLASSTVQQVVRLMSQLLSTSSVGTAVTAANVNPAILQVFTTSMLCAGVPVTLPTLTNAIKNQESSKPVELGAAMVSALAETPSDIMDAALEGDGLTKVLGVLVSAARATRCTHITHHTHTQTHTHTHTNAHTLPRTQ